VFTAASETFSRRNINCTVGESLKRFEDVVAAAEESGIAVRGYVSCVVNCPYEVPAVSVPHSMRLATSHQEVSRHEINTVLTKFSNAGSGFLRHVQTPHCAPWITQPRLQLVYASYDYFSVVDGRQEWLQCGMRGRPSLHIHSLGAHDIEFCGRATSLLELLRMWRAPSSTWAATR